MTFMLKVLFIIVLLFAPAITESEPQFKVITFQEFEAMTAAPSEQFRIYNFWATWCAPCVKEMPYFEQAAKEFTDIELVFISMDDGRKPDRVTAFMEKRNILSPVMLLDDVDFNSWIDKVDPSWSGAIPATLFISSNGKRHFHEGEVDQEELFTLINKFKHQ
jgi:thiol-disulfide isomerase/thioredoxin